MNVFIVNLAIADLSVGFLFVLTDAIWKLTIEWHAGNVICKVVKFGQVSVLYGSTYALVALSIDRLYAIARPLSISGQTKRSKILVSSCWLLSFMFSVPMFFVYEDTVVDGKNQCWVSLPDWAWPIYMTIVAVTILFIPLIIITACYIVIVVVIWRKTSLKIPDTATENTKFVSNGIGSNRKHNCSQNNSAISSRGLIPKAKIKTIKMTFVIVLAFIVCWSPYFIFDLLWVFQLVPRTTDSAAISTFVQSLAPLNSAANPVIYMIFNTKLCKKFFRRARFSNSALTNSYVTHV
ncbi:hypothetical protein ScPMuIL_017165 [Solemya velum]